MLDLMLFDIIGIEVFEEDKIIGECCLCFLWGFVFINLLFADEINCILLKI